MIDFTIETQVDRPAADVFDYVTDPAKLPEWQTTAVSSVPESGGPLVVGMRLREIHRAPGGREIPSVVEVTEFEPGRVFALRVVQGPPVHLRMDFEPNERGTLVRMRAHGGLRGPLRLAEPVLGRFLRRQFTGYAATLKRVLEAGAPAQSPAP